MKWSNLKPLKKLVQSNGGSTAGRNNAGRITIYHRGGGAKRLQRKVDLKRSTSSMGIVERIEYDPNRSSRVALVRWIEGVHPDNQKKCEKDFMPPQQKTAEPVTKTVAGQFPLACLAPGLMTVNKDAGGKISSIKDVFVSAFSSQQSKGESAVKIPRIALAGSRPAVFAPQDRDQVKEGDKEFSLSEVRRWNKDSVLWEHRLKRKAAVSWVSFVREGPVGLAAVADISESKSVSKSSKNRADEVDCVPLSYIIASDEVKPGQMVMNCDWSKRPSRS